MPWVQPGIVQYVRDHLNQVFLLELTRRQIDRDADLRQAGVVPRLHLRTGSAQYPFADRDNQAKLLRQWNEIRR